jgi:hypothetical protein
MHHLKPSTIKDLKCLFGSQKINDEIYEDVKKNSKELIRSKSNQQGQKRNFCKTKKVCLTDRPTKMFFDTSDSEDEEVIKK